VARKVNRLTWRAVTAMKEPGLHADGGGLYLSVDKTGAKRWAFLFQWRGARKEMGLGSIALVDLKEAREQALAARKLVAANINPIEERKTRRATAEAATFGEVADQLITDLAAGWRNPKQEGQWKLSLEVHAKEIRGLPVASISTEDVLAVLKPIWAKTPETASRTRGRIERALDAAKAKGLRVGDNPARWRGHLALLLAKRQRLTRGHFPAMPFSEVAAFMAELKDRPATAARALEVTLLTACRTGEVLGATWREVDLKGALWIIPAERMKAGVEHRVPLSPKVVEILTALRLEDTRPAHYVFPGFRDGRPLSNMAMEMLLRRMGHTDITVHGFRSTFRDWAGEATNFAREVAEAALAHTIGNAVERSYRRGDALLKRRKLMEAWANYCYRPGGSSVLQMVRS
jgi:integrase